MSTRRPCQGRRTSHGRPSTSHPRCPVGPRKAGTGPPRRLEGQPELLSLKEPAQRPAGRREPRPVSNLSRSLTSEPGFRPSLLLDAAPDPSSDCRDIGASTISGVSEPITPGSCCQFPPSRTGGSGSPVDSRDLFDSPAGPPWMSDGCPRRQPPAPRRQPPAREGEVYGADTPMSIDRRLQCVRLCRRLTARPSGPSLRPSESHCDARSTRSAQ
jgi:hypothetical protein